MTERKPVENLDLGETFVVEEKVECDNCQNITMEHSGTCPNCGADLPEVY